MMTMKILLLLLPCGLLVGCAGPGGFADVVKNAGTANKHIKAEFSGWNAHFYYESWPMGGVTNSDSVLVTPTTTLNTSPVFTPHPAKP